MPAELGPGPGRASALTEQDLDEIAAEAYPKPHHRHWVPVVRCHTVIVMLARPRSDPPWWPAHAGQWQSAQRHGVRVGRQDAAEVAARGDVELGEDLAQVVLDGAPRQEQPGADFGVREAVAGQPGDLGLLSSQ